MAQDQQSDFQYVKLPDGSYGKFAGNAPDEQISAQIAKDFPGAIAAQSGTQSAAPQTFDEKYVAPQMAPPNEGLGHHIARGASNFGGGVIGGVTSPFLHPIETAKSVFSMSPVGMAYGAMHGDKPLGADIIAALKEHPEETIESGLGGLAGNALLAGGTAEVAPKVFSAIPTKGHAGRLLQEIRPIAEQTNTMVSPTNTEPALQTWRQLMQAGGKPSGQKAITSLEKLQLGTPKTPAQPSPMPWPDAALRYSNVAEQAREPVLQRLMGRGMTPKVKAAAGTVRSGLRNDLSAAAQSMGQGEQFENAMTEYRRAAMLNKALKVGGGLALGEAARRTGLLGNWIHRTALQQ